MKEMRARGRVSVKKALSLFIAAVLLAVMLSIPASAENTGKAYTYRATGRDETSGNVIMTALPIPDPYRTVDVISGYKLASPTDMCFANGYLYIMNDVDEVKYDGINATGRIVVLDADMNFVREIFLHDMPYKGEVNEDGIEIDEPTVEEPIDEPVDEPTTEVPTEDEPTTDDPTSEDPTTEEPTSDEPTSDEPTTDEPTTDEPTSDEPTEDEPATAEPAAPVREKLVKPAGIWVNDTHIFICDYSGHRIIQTDLNGKFVRFFNVPKNEQVYAALLGDDAKSANAEQLVTDKYLPAAVSTNSNGDIFIRADNDYSGLMHLTADGEFITYFGAASVVVTGQLLFEVMWRAFLDFIGAESPTITITTNGYSNFTIGPDGQYIYAVRASTEDGQELVRKLNPLSVNVLKNKGYFGDLYSTTERGQTISTRFNAITVDDSGSITVLDSSRCRLFQYAAEGWRMFIFGGQGTQEGTFVEPVALASNGNRLYVLDKAACTVTVMEPTEFGSLIRNAENLYTAGKFDEAMVMWKRVIDLCPNYQFAYEAASRTEYLNKNYDMAMYYAKLANNSEYYSNAFKQERSVIIKENFTWVFIVLVALLVLGTTWGFLRRKGIIEVKKVELDQHGKFKYFIHCLFHPIDGFSEMRYNHKQSLFIANCCMLLYILSYMVDMQWWGWSFGGPWGDGSLNLVFVIAQSAGYYFLFVLVNWLLGTFLVGKARFKELWICICYALIPLAVSWFICTALSNILTGDEGAIMGYIYLIGEVWSWVLLFFAIKETQMYGFIRTLVSIILTNVGIVIVLFIMLLMFTLIVQFVDFIKSVYNEALYRIRSQ